MRIQSFRLVLSVEHACLFFSPFDYQVLLRGFFAKKEIAGKYGQNPEKHSYSTTQNSIVDANEPNRGLI